MWMRHSEPDMSRGTSTSSCFSSLTFILILVLGVSTRIAPASSAQPGDSTLQNFRLLSLPTHHDELIHPSLPSGKLDLGKTRKAREVSRGVEDDSGPSIPSSSSSSDYNQQQRQLSASKFKALYPPLSGSGELLRLFRPLALSPDKTIGMGRWYLPGFGYFSRGGRAASSNFIRFGRSGKFMEEDDGSNGGGDVTMLSRNNAKKKNNFIRLGRENPRQTNFIRLGRSGPPSDLYNGGYVVTPPLAAESFRDDEDGRHEFN